MPRMTNQELVAALKPGQLIRVLSEPGWGRRTLYTRDGDVYEECEEQPEEGELLTFLYSHDQYSVSRGRTMLQLYFLNMAGMVVCAPDIYMQTTDLQHQFQPVEQGP